MEPGTTYRSRTRYSSPTISPVSRGRERRGIKKTELRGGVPARRCDPPKHPELSASLQARPWRTTSPTLPHHLARGSSFLFTRHFADSAPLTSRPDSILFSHLARQISRAIPNLEQPSHPDTSHSTRTYRHVHDRYRLVELRGELIHSSFSRVQCDECNFPRN